MNVYDFDKTILDGDTEEYFFAYINKYKLMSFFKIKKMNHIIKKVVNQKVSFDANMTKVYKIITSNIKYISEVVEKFWDEHQQFIKPFYENIRRDDDVISSATPDFLFPIFKRLNLKNTIASKYNFKNQTFDNGFNFGENKVFNFVSKYGTTDNIDKFYSDSDSDLPLARCAKHAFKVTGNKIEDWII